ncbi:hypothetical protein O181_024206 [Austropuccinia psidii MF-1]|uniref:Uncharacterized protein n=1 Tax=Austropuccinia psidii MF-1 TaxID=1389203 RepID=A0A9Q3CKZ1_9BASI|nr:hypothetical protein [Austropuccinia psidii MF-1]
MSQFAEKTQENFEKLHENILGLQKLIHLQNKTIQTLKEGYAKPIQASEETNKRLNQVLEEKYHCKRERGTLDKDIKKLFDFFQKMKPQSQGNVFGNTPSLQEDIKAKAPMGSKHRFPLQYQDRDDMT